MYLIYLAVSTGLTVWVATTLSRNGLVFLQDVFGEDRLARAVNHLLVVGFYLVNLGYVTIAMKTGETVGSAADVLEALSRKVGAVLLVLGALHLFNVYALGRYRRSRQRRTEAWPPTPPDSQLPLTTPPLPHYPAGAADREEAAGDAPFPVHHTGATRPPGTAAGTAQESRP